MAAGKNSAHYAPESIVSVNLEIEFDVIIAINCIVLSAVVAQPLARSLRNLVHVLRRRRFKSPSLQECTEFSCS